MYPIAIFLFIIISFFSQSHAQDSEPFRIFDKKGKVIKFSSMIKEVKDSDVVFFGEIHNSVIAHWLELQLFKELIALDSKIRLGMEMLEADNQLLVNEYLNGTIAEKSYLTEIKKWDNYQTDYHPLVNLAKQNNISVIAT